MFWVRAEVLEVAGDAHCSNILPKIVQVSFVLACAELPIDYECLRPHFG